MSIYDITINTWSLSGKFSLCVMWLMLACWWIFKGHSRIRMLRLAWRQSTSKSSSLEPARLLATAVLGAECPNQISWGHSRRFRHTSHPPSYSSRLRHRSQPAHCLRWSHSLSLLKLTLYALCILRSFGKLTTGWFSNLNCTKNVCCVFVCLYVCFAVVGSFHANKVVAKVQLQNCIN